MILTPDELVELTGKKTRTAQAQVLRFMGVEHRRRPDGSLVVLKSHVDLVFGAVSEQKEPEYHINWSAINA